MSHTSNTATERSTLKQHLFSGALRRKRVNRLAETKYLQLGSNEGLTLETSVFKTLYGGQFALQTQMIKQIIYLQLHLFRNFR